MAGISYHDLDELKNRNEEKVWQAIEKYLDENEDLCSCRDCILDAAAIALNNLPPRYQVYTFHANAPEDNDPGDDVMAAVIKAFEQVKSKPHHF